MSMNLVAPRSLQELTERLQESFSDMPPQFQIGARYLLDNPSEVPISSMRKIAQQAGVQPATLVRLAQSLGYEGWTGLKEIFVHSLHAGEHAYALQARKVVRQRHRPDRVAKAVEAQTHNVQKLSELNSGRLSKAVDILVKARRVYVAGFRASYASAFTFHYLYRFFRPSVTMMRSEAGTFEMELRSLRPGDVIVLIAFAPYSQEIVRVYEAARKTGCKILSLCDSPVAPIALEADCNLLFSTDMPSFFPSCTASVALVEVLVEQVLARTGRRAISGLEHAETQLQQIGAYWTKEDE
ncbi:MAG TPA: MurR/RpiR family transcriptional regulator [Paenalcaligenes sp.]|nr:MurR/RpiR family transcriptional regulator [Paenalcaligenes sp.]